MIGALREKMSALANRPDSSEETAWNVRTLVITIIVLAAVLGGLFLWRALRMAAPDPSAPPPVPVAAMVVTPQVAPASLEAVATLTGVREVTLSPDVSGRITEIRFSAGQWVRSGALLLQLYDGTEQADRKAAVARAEFARLQLERSEELAPTGAEPLELLEQRRAERQQALAAIQQIDARIRQKQIRAPFSGQLGIRRVDPGQYVNPGDPVATLTSLNSLFVNFSLPQQELARITVGSQVTVLSDAHPDRTFTARVNAIDPVIDSQTRNVNVQATLSNSDQALRPGMYVTAALALPPEPNALIVPATAIQTSARGNSVVVIRGDDAAKGGTADFVPVVTGRRIGESVVIDQGLASGDVIVANGQLRLQPDAKVTVDRLLGEKSR